MGGGAALEVHLLALVVDGGVHGGGEVDHPGDDGLDQGVVQEVDGEGDAAEEVEGGRRQDAARVLGEEDAQQDQAGAEVVPVAAHVCVFLGQGGHEALHDVRPVGVFWRVLRVAGEEHAGEDEDGGERGGERGGGGVFEVVVEFGDEHAGDDVEAFEGAYGEAWGVGISMGLRGVD